MIPSRLGEVVRERRSRPSKALLGREWKMKVGIRGVEVDGGGITAGRRKRWRDR